MENNTENQQFTPPPNAAENEVYRASDYDGFMFFGYKKSGKTTSTEGIVKSEEVGELIYNLIRAMNEDQDLRAFILTTAENFTVLGPAIKSITKKQEPNETKTIQ